MNRIQRQKLFTRWVSWGLFYLLGFSCLLAGCAEVDLGSLGGVIDAVQTAQDTVDTAKDVAETTQEVMESFEEIPPEDEYYLGRAVGANIAGQYTLYEEERANTYIRKP